MRNKDVQRGSIDVSYPETEIYVSLNVAWNCETVICCRSNVVPNGEMILFVFAVLTRCIGQKRKATCGGVVAAIAAMLKRHRMGEEAERSARE